MRPAVRSGSPYLPPDVAWIAALSIALAIEKLAPRGEPLAKLLDLALNAAGALRLLLLAF
jgi:predicted metal-binding membrane protein